MLSNHLILCHPLLLLPSIFPSIRVFSNESALRIRGPKFLSFSISISPSNEYSGLISCRIDYFDLLAGQGTLKSLLQNHSLKDKCHYKIKSFFKERIRKQQFLYTLIISKSNYIIFFKVKLENALYIQMQILNISTDKENDLGYSSLRTVTLVPCKCFQSLLSITCSLRYLLLHPSLCFPPSATDLLSSLASSWLYLPTTSLHDSRLPFQIHKPIQSQICLLSLLFYFILWRMGR